MWVLIFTLWTSNGVASGSAEFSSKESCVSAAKAYQKINERGLSTVYVMCAQK